MDVTIKGLQVTLSVSRADFAVRTKGNVQHEITEKFELIDEWCNNG
jgi:hypothetical protein